MADAVRLSVLISSRRMPTGCADYIKQRGGEALGVVCDVTDEAQVQAAVTQARETFGGIDILVNGRLSSTRRAYSICRWPSGRARLRSS